MHTLVPIADTKHARAALDEAMRIADRGDAITVTALVVVPAYYAPDVHAYAAQMRGAWAARLLDAARARVTAAELPANVDVRYVRVQAPDAATAIVRGAEAYGADLILFAGRAGVWGSIARRLGTVGTVARHAPCGVRVVTDTAHPAAPTDSTVIPAAQGADAATTAGGLLHLLRRPHSHVHRS